VALAGSLTALGYPQTGAALGLGLCFGTLLVTPDLDLHLNDARRHWGSLRFIWGPYAALSRHRSLSHTYLLGPTIRLLYLAVWLPGPAVLVWQLLGDRIQVTSTHVRWLALAAIGYYLAQWLHLVGDGILPLTQRPRSRRVRSAPPAARR
jgi:uncharacterized metal-binding protein